MFTAYGKFWKNYVNFKGRSSRSDFWWATLVNALVYVILMVVGFGPFLVAFFSSQDVKKVSAGVFIVMGLSVLALLIYLLATILPTLSLAYRRLVDTGLSPWWYSLVVLEVITNFMAESSVSAISDPASVVNIILTIVLIVLFAMKTDKFSKQPPQSIEE
ncbi:DUF805 domain-containing protein [Fructobacillus papyrifericola]|uniref:DUF805 domain-containing protein n=1 Tax=Fructobacillus papyrifericola TaxID=2713172 RepID=A0ABS5QT42_9LACO|nr:DUF805 domain-containing protein [Fructobacillus papyrifericola]MBS9336370.1 DUF805 domain-containing protein [Fructobacillus papyrifericola]